MNHRFAVHLPLTIMKILVICAGMCVSAQTVSAQFRQLPQKEKQIVPEPGKSLYESIKQEDRGGRITMPFKSDRGVTVANVKELTRRSSDIIIGRPLRSQSALNERGDDINTVILIQVQSVIKGTIKNGGLVDLKTPGGAWMYSDKTRITRFPTDARLLQENASYFIFMIKESKDKKLWIPALGTQSLFEVDSDTESITPCDLVETDPVVKKYKNAPMGEFMSEILAAVVSETPKNSGK